MSKSMFVVLSLLAAQSANANTAINVGPEEISASKLKGDFKEGLFRLTGILPTACADRLNMTEVTSEKPEKSEDSVEGQDISKDELKNYATKVRVTVTFQNDSDYLSLNDCLKKNETSTDRRNVELYHLMPTSAKMAIVTVGEGGTEWKSPEMIRLEKQYSNLDCPSCNSSWSKARSTLRDARGFDSPLLDAMMSKLVEESIKDAESKIDASTQVVELEKTRTQLFEMLDFAKADLQKEAIIQLLEKSVAKNFDLAKSGHKTASMASKHADFAHDTFNALSKLKLVDDSKRTEYKHNAASFSKGNDQRVHFISSIDGDNPEVRDYLKAADSKQRALLSEMNRTCRTQNPQAFMLCGEMQKVFQQNEKILGDLQNRYVSSYNEVWNNMYSQWDHSNQQNDQSWKNTYQIQSPTNAMNPAVNSQNPANIQYTGVDRSGTQQIMNATPGTNPNQYPSLYFPVN